MKKTAYLVTVTLLLVILIGGLYLQRRAPDVVRDSDLCGYDEPNQEITEEIHRFGDFRLETGEVFSLVRAGDPDRTVFRFNPGNFIGAARAGHLVSDNAGSFKIDQKITQSYRIEEWRLSTFSSGRW